MSIGEQWQTQDDQKNNDESQGAERDESSCAGEHTGHAIKKKAAGKIAGNSAGMAEFEACALVNRNITGFGDDVRAFRTQNIINEEFGQALGFSLGVHVKLAGNGVFA